MIVPQTKNGILNIDKPQGITSHDVVDAIRKIFPDQKVGHTGTLDPLATGVLPLLIGKGTLCSKYLMNHDKTYKVLLKLGIKKSTGDEEGDILQQEVVDEELLDEKKINKYIFWGGKEEADRCILIFFPEKLDRSAIEKNYNKIFKVIRIKLPSNLNYKHSEFLSGIMKLGIKREKFGDIIVTDFGADIIVFSELADVLCEDLKMLTRFRKSHISIENIKDVTIIKPEYENINIIVSSIRLDNFISELARCSRTKATEVISLGKVYINSVNEFKESKRLQVNDIITIRGKGKFIFDSIEKTTRSGKYLINIRKYK